VGGRAGAPAKAVSSPTAISTQFCRAAVLIFSGFVGMAAFSPLSRYCRVFGMLSRRDRAVSVTLQTSMNTERSMFKKRLYTEQLA
jgi:hypothetical protein